MVTDVTLAQMAYRESYSQIGHQIGFPMSSKRDQQSSSLGGTNVGHHDFSVSGIVVTPYDVRNSEEYQASYGDYIRRLIAETRKAESDPVWDHPDAKNWRF